MKNKVIKIVLICCVVLLGALLVFSVFNKETSATVTNSKNYASQIRALDERCDELSSAVSALQSTTFVGEKLKHYELFTKESGIIKICATRSGDNYIDFYDETDGKVGALTFNLSKNDVLFITYSEYGCRINEIKIHSGSDPETHDYSGTALAYFVLVNNEAVISIE